MNMLTKAIATITDGLAKYKQERVQATVDAYTRAISAHAVKTLPARIDLINDVANVIITKTYENSKPLTDFLAAAQTLINHYGPEVSTAAMRGYLEVKSVMDKFETSPEFVEMTEAIEAMQADTTDASVSPETIAAAAAAAATPAN